MNSLYFTEEHELFRESLRSFLQKEVIPHIEKWEKTGTIERFIWEKFGEMGFFGLKYPEAYGGLGLDLFYTVVFLEELQKIKSSGFAAAMWAHAYLAMTHLNAEGSEKIKQEYLAPSIAGDKIFCPVNGNANFFQSFPGKACKFSGCNNLSGRVKAYTRYT